MYRNADVVTNTSDTAFNTDQILAAMPKPLVPEKYDQIVLNPPALPTVITYLLAGVPVATLNIAYVGTDVASVTRV